MNYFSRIAENYSAMATHCLEIGKLYEATNQLWSRVGTINALGTTANARVYTTGTTRRTRRNARKTNGHGKATAVSPTVEKIQQWATHHKGTITPKTLIDNKLGNRVQVSRALRQMVEGGILSRSGHGRGVSYSPVAVN